MLCDGDTLLTEALRDAARLSRTLPRISSSRPDGALIITVAASCCRVIALSWRKRPHGRLSGSGPRGDAGGGRGVWAANRGAQKEPPPTRSSPVSSSPLVLVLVFVLVVLVFVPAIGIPLLCFVETETVVALLDPWPKRPPCGGGHWLCRHRRCRCRRCRHRRRRRRRHALLATPNARRYDVTDVGASAHAADPRPRVTPLTNAASPRPRSLSNAAQ